MTAALVTTWPAMSVKSVGVQFLRHWRTTDERATGQLTFEDGTGVAFRDIDLPPTDVWLESRFVVITSVFSGSGPLGTVNPCAAIGTEPEGTLTIELDAEPVVMENGIKVAKTMGATATFVAANGDVWSGPGAFPDSPLVGSVAQPVVAKFMLEKQ